MLYAVIHMLHRKYPASDNYDIRVFYIAADSEQAATHQFMANNVVLPEDYAYIGKQPKTGDTTQQIRDDRISKDNYHLLSNAYRTSSQYRCINATTV